MPTSTIRTFPAPQGNLSKYGNLLNGPDDHAIGRSRSGLTTRIHALVDGNMRPVVLLLGPGQGGHSPMFENLMDALKIEREGPGRPVSYDKDTYKHRNVVERSFNTLKQ